MTARLRLVRERPDWRLVMRGSLARYETVWHDEPLETADIDDPGRASRCASRAARFRPLPHRGRRDRRHGRDLRALPRRLGRLRQPRRAGQGGRAPPTARCTRPARPPASTSRRPSPGAATVLVLTDRVHCAAHRRRACRRHRRRRAGGRRLGTGRLCRRARVPRRGRRDVAGRAAPSASTWVGIDPGRRARSPSRSTVARPHRAARARRGAGAHRARRLGQPGRGGRGHPAPDQLRLARSGRPFPRPPPARPRHPRRLGPADRAARRATSTALRQGGDEGGCALPEIPQKTVTLFTPPVQAGAGRRRADPARPAGFQRPGPADGGGLARQPRRRGRRPTSIVRDPMVAEPLLPRFLAPGDEARLAVLLQNLDLPAGEAVARDLRRRPARRRRRRPAGRHARARRAGAAVHDAARHRRRARRDPAGCHRPGGFHVSARPRSWSGRRARAVDDGARRRAGAGRRSAARPGARPHSRRHLARLGGLRRRGALRCRRPGPGARRLPAAVPGTGDQPRLAAGAAAGRADRRRRPRGPAAAGRGASCSTSSASTAGSACGPPAGEAETWLSAYATEFLLRARDGRRRGAGGGGEGRAEIPGRATPRTAGDARGHSPARPTISTCWRSAGQPRAGREPGAGGAVDKLPTPLAKAQLGAALALAQRPRRGPRRRSPPRSRRRARRTGTRTAARALRDQAAIAVLLKESGLLPRPARAPARRPAGRRPAARDAQHPGEAWAAAAAAVLGRDGRAGADGGQRPRASRPRPVVHGRARPARPRRATSASAPVWQTLSGHRRARRPAPAGARRLCA